MFLLSTGTALVNFIHCKPIKSFPLSYFFPLCIRVAIPLGGNQYMMLLPQAITAELLNKTVNVCVCVCVGNSVLTSSCHQLNTCPSLKDAVIDWGTSMRTNAHFISFSHYWMTSLLFSNSAAHVLVFSCLRPAAIPYRRRYARRQALRPD